ncbi:hypothetical protein [Arthrobacter sp. UYCu712]|uniref:hypothetical protein n=1 Tax=Arthrobacter sp. UYCu712 TaxID=3156340 RepID=UPI003395EAC3
MIEVTVADGMSEDAALKAAIDTVSIAANAHSVGILITPLGKNKFVVRAHPQVPTGLVRRRLQ